MQYDIVEKSDTINKTVIAKICFLRKILLFQPPADNWINNVHVYPTSEFEGCVTMYSRKYFFRHKLWYIISANMSILVSIGENWLVRWQ